MLFLQHPRTILEPQPLRVLPLVMLSHSSSPFLTHSYGHLYLFISHDITGYYLLAGCVYGIIHSINGAIKCFKSTSTWKKSGHYCSLRKTEPVRWGRWHAMFADLQGLSVPMPKRSMLRGRFVAGETSKKMSAQTVRSGSSAKLSTNGCFFTHFNTFHTSNCWFTL